MLLRSTVDIQHWGMSSLQLKYGTSTGLAQFRPWRMTPTPPSAGVSASTSLDKGAPQTYCWDCDASVTSFCCSAVSFSSAYSFLHSTQWRTHQTVLLDKSSECRASTLGVVFPVVLQETDGVAGLAHDLPWSHWTSHSGHLDQALHRAAMARFAQWGMLLTVVTTILSNTLIFPDLKWAYVDLKWCRKNWAYFSTLVRSVFCRFSNYDKVLSTWCTTLQVRKLWQASPWTGPHACV